VQEVEKTSLADFCGNEVLQVRAYGQAYIGLGVNIRFDSTLYYRVVMY
jgi:hypothetical protein